jgi:hypothetical protein
MDAKLTKILCSPDFEAWRYTLWKEISQEAIQHGWVAREDLRQHDGVINPDSERWSQLYARLVCYCGDKRTSECCATVVRHVRLTCSCTS